MTENFCMACESFNSQERTDYSGGPGVAVCSCGRKNTIVEVPEGNRDFVRTANENVGQLFPRLMTEVKEGRLTIAQAERLVELADPSEFRPERDYRAAEESFFELLDEVQ